MRNLQRRADLAERDMCHINFALAKAYEDLGDVGLAYKHYLEGNALRKKELQYEPATEEVFFNCLKNTFRDLQKIRLRLHKQILVRSNLCSWYA